jgi:hypothetical protein
VPTDEELKHVKQALSSCEKEKLQAMFTELEQVESKLKHIHNIKEEEKRGRDLLKRDTVEETRSTYSHQEYSDRLPQNNRRRSGTLSAMKSLSLRTVVKGDSSEITTKTAQGSKNQAKKSSSKSSERRKSNQSRDGGNDDRRSNERSKASHSSLSSQKKRDRREEENKNKKESKDKEEMNKRSNPFDHTNERFEDVLNQGPSMNLRRVSTRLPSHISDSSSQGGETNRYRRIEGADLLFKESIKNYIDTRPISKEQQEEKPLKMRGECPSFGCSPNSFEEIEDKPFDDKNEEEEYKKKNKKKSAENKFSKKDYKEDDDADYLSDNEYQGRSNRFPNSAKDFQNKQPYKPNLNKNITSPKSHSQPPTEKSNFSTDPSIGVLVSVLF